MSNMSMEASSLSFNSEDWANLEETKPFSAVYAVKKEVQTGICQYGGMACLVIIKVGKLKAMNLVTSSDVIADLKTDKKPTEMHPLLMKKDCHLVVKSPVNKFGPFSFLSLDPQSSPGLQKNPNPTCLDFQVPKRDLESKFEAYTFVGSDKLKLTFEYEGGTGKYILSRKEKKAGAVFYPWRRELELSSVLGAPIIIENKDVRIKHLSSRWSVVGVMRLNEERELSPYFVTADLFDSRPVKEREEERSVPDNESNTTAADSRPVQREEEQSVPDNELNTTAVDSRPAQREEERSVPDNESNTTAADSFATTQIDREEDIAGSSNSSGDAHASGGSAVFRTTENYPTDTELIDKDSHGNVLKVEFYEKSLNFAKEAGDRPTEGKAYYNLGSAYNSLRDFPKAIEYYQESLRIAREAGDQDTEKKSYQSLMNASTSHEDLPKAIERFKKNLNTAMEAGDRAAEGKASYDLGTIYFSANDFPEALKCYEKTVHLAREAGDRAGEILGHFGVGMVYFCRRDFAKAVKCFEESEKMAKEAGNHAHVKRVSALIAESYLVLGDSVKAEQVNSAGGSGERDAILQLASTSQSTVPEAAVGLPARATSQRIIREGDGKSLTRPGNVESQESPSCGPK